MMDAVAPDLRPAAATDRPARTIGPHPDAATAPVLVLDAAQRSALAVIRSLGRRGIPVIAADSVEPTLGGRSRHARATAVYTDPARDGRAFLDDIARLAAEHGAGMVLPATELTTYVLAEAAPDLGSAVLAVPPFEAFELLSDKYRLFRLAETLDVPVPPTRYVDRAEHAAGLAADIGYPVVIKPYRSWIRTDTTWHATRVRHVPDAAALRAAIEQDPALTQHPFLLQGYVHGTGQGVFAAYDEGREVAWFAHRRLREKPPAGGVSVLCESMPVPANLREVGSRLLDEAGWHGIAMVEFKVGTDGTPWLMEINPRLWGSLQLAVDAGVDFPWLLHQIMLGARPEPVTTYRTGQRLRWLLGDLDRLYLVLRDGTRPWHERVREAGAFLRPDFRNVRHDVARRDDPGPFRGELGDYLRALLPAARRSGHR